MTTNALVQVAKGGDPAASDINQIVSSLQGALDIGPVTLFPAITAVPTAPTATAGGSGNLTGQRAYVVSYRTGNQLDNGTIEITGETLPGTASAAVTLSSQTSNVANIPAGPPGTIGRGLYTNKQTGSVTTGPWYLVSDINDNTTTTFPDNVPDASLGVQSPSSNTTGSYLSESTLLGKREMIPDYDQYMSSPDANDIYTIVTLKRPDGTQYFVSTLSNPNANGFYQTDTWKFYDAVGTTVVNTHVWSITYDANGRKTQAVMTS